MSKSHMVEYPATQDKTVDPLKVRKDGETDPYAGMSDEDRVKEMEKETRLNKYKEWIVAGMEAKKSVEWEWFVRKSYLDGNHWVQWNSQTNSLETIGQGNKFKTTINKIYQTCRAVRAYITKHDPKWEVMAQDLDKKVFNKAIGSEKFLETYWFQEQVKRKIKELVGDAMYASCGHLWFHWDSDKKWLISEAVEPFDFIPDPTAQDYLEYTDALFVVRSRIKKVNELADDTRFDEVERLKIISDDKLAASDIKTSLIQMTPGANTKTWMDKKDLNTCLTFEGYYRVDEDNDKGGNINHFIITNTAILVDESTMFSDMPARTYHTDIETNKQYTQGWVKNLIAPQKILDTLEGSTLEFNHVISRGRYVTEKGSGVSSVYNKHGQIIEKNKGSYFEQLPMQSQPVTVENQITRANRYIEDMGASHDAFMGRMPTGANSGVAIETLLAGEENNLSDLRDNLSIFLISTAKFILKSFSRHMVDIYTFYAQEPNEKEPNFYALTGKKSPNAPTDKKKEVTVQFDGTNKKVTVESIVEDNNIRVTIGTWIGTGKLDSQDRLIKLYDAKLIDQQTVLEFFNAPNIPRIIENTTKRLFEEAAAQAAVSNLPGTMPATKLPGMGGGAPQATLGVPPPISQGQ